MSHRLWVAAGALFAVCGVALTAGGAYAYYFDSTRTDVIAVGVQIAGVDVGGLHAAEAKELLTTRLNERLHRSLQIVSGTHRFTVYPARAGLRIDIAGMVAAAVKASRSGNLAHRFFRDVGGQPLRETIPLTGELEQQHLELLVRHIAHVVYVPPKNARVVPTTLATGVHVGPPATGLAVDRPLLTRELANALLTFDAPRTVNVPTVRVQPHIGLAAVNKRYSTYLLVSRETFTLRLYKNLKLAKTYRIAVGRQGLETPAGEYTINDKQVNPSWHVPLSSWAGSLAGQIIPPGPADPIKARWMGFFDGAGIHGTDEIWSIGTAASHGCIRMTIPDVEDLYPRVPLHSPIYVG